MKFGEKFKKNKGKAAVPETAQDSGKKKRKPDPKKLVGTMAKNISQMVLTAWLWQQSLS